MSASTNLFRPPPKSYQPAIELKNDRSIPREFVVTTYFDVSCDVRVFATCKDEALELVRDGHGRWADKKDWDAGNGETSYDLHEWDDRNETIFLRIRGAR